MEWAPKNGIGRIEIEVFSNNSGAIHLYERIGFNRYGLRKNAVIIDGKAVDILLMDYVL